MSPDHVTAVIQQYGYWILIPLTFIEGPIVAFIAGGLAALGLFNIYILAVLFFVRDVGLDGVYYAIGYYGGRTRFAKAMLKKLKITEDHLDDIRKLWAAHAARTMFIGKVSYGIATAFIVVAGIVKMPLGRFFKYGALVAVAQYGTLLLLGYFLGNAFQGSVLLVLENLQYALAALVIFITIYYIFTFYMRGRFIKEDEKAQHSK